MGNICTSETRIVFGTRYIEEHVQTRTIETQTDELVDNKFIFITMINPKDFDSADTDSEVYDSGENYLMERWKKSLNRINDDFPLDDHSPNYIP